MVDETLRQRFVRRGELVLLLLVLACVAVPTGSDLDLGQYGDQTDVATPSRHALLGLVGTVWQHHPDAGSRGTHPVGLVGGLWLLRVGTVLLVVVLVVLAGVLLRRAVTGSASVHDEPLPARLVEVLAALLLAALAIAWLGSVWLPEERLSVGLDPGAVVVVATAVWALSTARTARELTPRPART